MKLVIRSLRAAIRSPFVNSRRSLTTSTSHIQTSNDANEDEIVKIFDSSDYWNKFNQQQSSDKTASNQTASIFDSLNFNSSRQKSVGLFCNPYLTSPKGLKRFAEESLDRARALTNHMIEDQSEKSMKSYITELDRLSDMLCRVIDLCEFVRAAHPNSSFVKAAEQCHAQLFEHMNVLNTSKPLFVKLQKVLYDGKLGIRKTLSQEEISVG